MFHKLWILWVFSALASGAFSQDLPTLEQAAACAPQILGYAESFVPDPKFLGDYPEQEVSFVVLFPQTAHAVELAFLRFENSNLPALISILNKQAGLESSLLNDTSGDTDPLLAQARRRWIQLLNLVALNLDKNQPSPTEIERIKKVFSLAIRLNRPLEYPSLETYGKPVALRSPIDVVFRDHSGRTVLGVWIDSSADDQTLVEVQKARDGRGREERIHFFAPSGLGAEQIAEFEKRKAVVHVYGRGTTPLLGDYSSEGKSLLALAPDIIERAEEAISAHNKQFANIVSQRQGEPLRVLLEEVWVAKRELAQVYDTLRAEVEQRRALVPFGSLHFKLYNRLTKLFVTLSKFAYERRRPQYLHFQQALAGKVAKVAFDSEEETRFVRWIRNSLHDATIFSVAVRVKAFQKAWESVPGSQVILGAKTLDEVRLTDTERKLQVELVFQDDLGRQAWGIVGADAHPLSPTINPNGWAYVLETIEKYRGLMPKLGYRFPIYVFWPSGMTKDARERLDALGVYGYGRRL